MDCSLEEALFFESVPESLALYLKLKEEIWRKIGNADIQVKKTQISFFRRRMFCAVSFLKAKRKAQLPLGYITVTFGLGYRKESESIAAAAQACPGRWTHHVVLGKPEDIGGELMAWLEEAAEFAESKR